MYTNEDFFRVFGHISIFFSTWDFFVTAIIPRLVRLDCKLPDLSTATLGQKLRYIQTLTPEQAVNTGVLKQIQSVLPVAIEKSQKRNRFIHDQWLFKPDLIAQGSIERLALSNGEGPIGRTLDFQSETFTLQQLYSFLEEIGEQQKVFAQIVNELNRVPQG